MSRLNLTSNQVNPNINTEITISAKYEGYNLGMFMGLQPMTELLLTGSN